MRANTGSFGAVPGDRPAGDTTSIIAPVPGGYVALQPVALPAPAFHHLHLRSTNPDAAIAFYTKAFGATQKMCMKNPNGTISHAEIEIGDSVVMMADEAPASDAAALGGNSHLSPTTKRRSIRC